MNQSVQTSDPASISRPISKRRRNGRPRVLMITPELNGSRILGPQGNGAGLCAKAGGLADIGTLLVDGLADRGLDVRVAMPHFRRMMRIGTGTSRRLHLCEDPRFLYRSAVYAGTDEENRLAALAFQRTVIHDLLPRIRPDVIHCHDWMTSLIPAAARRLGIPCLFTIHNIHDQVVTLAEIEDRGIDVRAFWQNLQYQRFPHSYDESLHHNPVQLMASAIHSADHVNTVSPGFMRELVEGRHPKAWPLGDVLHAKYSVGAASGILNAPDPSYSPRTDPALVRNYSDSDHATSKAANKREFQRRLGLEEDPDAPLLLWPSRLDPVQKGCDLLAKILYQLMSDYWGLGLQVALIADGPSQAHFHQIADFHGLRHRIAVHDFDETLSRQAYAASDFTLMPSCYEPCGLAQMVALKYGSLPIVHRTGGLADTVHHLAPEGGTGNGFSFEIQDPGGLRWAIDEAMRFFIKPAGFRKREISRIINQADREFDPERTVDAYLKIYQRLAARDGA